MIGRTTNQPSFFITEPMKNDYWTFWTKYPVEREKFKNQTNSHENSYKINGYLFPSNKCK